MKKVLLDNIIYDSVSKTIESMAFAEVLPTELSMVKSGKEDAVALSVSEPCAGSFQMIISRELLCAIAEAMLGTPREEIPEESLLDFLSELLNTIAGSVLNAALPDNMKFSLGLPHIISVDELSKTAQAAQWNFTVMETVFSITGSKEMVAYLNKSISTS